MIMFYLKIKSLEEIRKSIFNQDRNDLCKGEVNCGTSIYTEKMESLMPKSRIIEIHHEADYQNDYSWTVNNQSFYINSEMIETKIYQNMSGKLETTKYFGKMIFNNLTNQ